MNMYTKKLNARISRDGSYHEEVLKSNDFEVIFELIYNKNISIFTQIKIIKIIRDKIRNGTLSKGKQLKLLRHSNASFRKDVLYYSKIESIQMKAAAKKSHTREHMLDKAVLAYNRNLFDEPQVMLASPNCFLVNLELASNPKVSEEAQYILRYKKNPGIRAALARNFAISKETQLFLAQDKNKHVLFELSLNTRLCDEAKEMIK